MMPDLNYAGRAAAWRLLDVFLSQSESASKQIGQLCSAKTHVEVCVHACEMYQFFAVGSHHGGCRHPAQGGCRWTRQSVEASSGPESCAGFCCGTETQIPRVLKTQKTTSRSHRGHVAHGVILAM